MYHYFRKAAVRLHALVCSACRSDVSFCRGLIGNGYQTLDKISQIYEIIGTKEVPNVSLVVLAHSEQSPVSTLRPLLELATRPNAALPILIVAALPQYWPELDYLASFSQLSTQMFPVDTEAEVAQRDKPQGEVSEFTSAFSEVKFSNSSLLHPALLPLVRSPPGPPQIFAHLHILSHADTLNFTDCPTDRNFFPK